MRQHRGLPPQLNVPKLIPRYSLIEAGVEANVEALADVEADVEAQFPCKKW